MLPGFEDQTQPLSEYELTKILPSLVNNFMIRPKGKEFAVNNTKIVEWFKNRGKKTNTIRIRAVISYIQTEFMVPGLSGCSKGYFVTTDPKEYERWIRSMEGRRNKMDRIILNAKKHLITLQHQAVE